MSDWFVGYVALDRMHNDTVLAESRWNYVAFIRDGVSYLTFLLGGAVERDATVKLTASEVDELGRSPEFLDSLVRELKADAESLRMRALSEPIWPKSEQS